jgi:hypothetical protein
MFKQYHSKEIYNKHCWCGMLMYKYVFLLVVCCIFYIITLEKSIKSIQKKLNKLGAFLIFPFFIFWIRAPPIHLIILNG